MLQATLLWSVRFSRRNEGIVIKLLAIPVFMISVAFTTLIIKPENVSPHFSCRVVYVRSDFAVALCLVICGHLLLSSLTD